MIGSAGNHEYSGSNQIWFEAPGVAFHANTDIAAAGKFGHLVIAAGLRDPSLIGFAVGTDDQVGDAASLLESTHGNDVFGGARGSYRFWLSTLPIRSPPARVSSGEHKQHRVRPRP